MAPATLKKVLLPLLGLGGVLVVWTVISQIAHDLPSPLRTWNESRRYVLEPFFKDGEMNQGMGRLASYSLLRVGKGYLWRSPSGAHRVSSSGSRARSTRRSIPSCSSCAPFRPWRGSRSASSSSRNPSRRPVFRSRSAPCADRHQHGVGRAGISQDYLNVGRVLSSRGSKMLSKNRRPASLPYVFTGLSPVARAGVLVIVAAEMLTGRPAWAASSGARNTCQPSCNSTILPERDQPSAPIGSTSIA